MDYQPQFDANRELWNTRTPIHLDSKFYDVDAFLAGKSSLTGVEEAEMGDVAGKSLLHLQCHFGLDTLSFARQGAEVVGVDFSEVSIQAARDLATKSNLPAEFVCENVFDLPERLSGQFDIIFASYGVLGWLPNLDRYAEVVKHFLKPRGYYYLLEFHPYFSQHNQHGQLEWDYFYDAAPPEELDTSTYTDGPSHAAKPNYWWNHPLSHTLSAFLRQGMSIETFREYPYSPYRLSDQMIEIEPGRYVYENLRQRIPYLYSLKVRH